MRVKAFVRRNGLTYGKAHGGYHNAESRTNKETGWTWVEVGHNSSCVFYVGHDKGYDQFAVKSYDCDDYASDPDIYNYNPTLSGTISGAYLGHF